MIGRKIAKIFQCRKREAKINSVVFECSYCAYASFTFIKIFSFDITNRYFYCLAYWLLSSFLVIVFVTHTFSAVESFLFISSFRFSCFCHRVCLRTREPHNVLISNFCEVLRFYLILSTFLSIQCAQVTTLIKQCSKVSMKTYHWSLKVVLLFLEAKLLLRYQIGSFFAVS